jgi:hypothetical protein
VESESNCRETKRESRGSARVQRDYERELRQVDDDRDDGLALTVGVHECTTVGMGQFPSGMGTRV